MTDDDLPADGSPQWPELERPTPEAALRWLQHPAAPERKVAVLRRLLEDSEAYGRCFIENHAHLLRWDAPRVGHVHLGDAINGDLPALTEHLVREHDGEDARWVDAPALWHQTHHAVAALREANDWQTRMLQRVNRLAPHAVRAAISEEERGLTVEGVAPEE